MEITDPGKIIAIYRDPGKTRILANKYQCSTRTIARIKNARAEYREIVRDYKQKLYEYLITERFGFCSFYVAGSLKQA